MLSHKPNRRSSQPDAAKAGAARRGATRRATCAALLFAVVGSPAAAADFTLDGGVRLKGEISAAGRRYVTITTKAGARLVARSALREVSLASANGQRVVGRLQNWRAGEYTLETAGGVVTAKEAADPAASSGASRIAAVSKAQGASPAKAQTGGGAAPKAPAKAQTVEKAAPKAAERTAQSGGRAASAPSSPIAAPVANAELAGDLEKRTIGSQRDVLASADLQETAAAFDSSDETLLLRGKLDDILSGAPPASDDASGLKAPTATLAQQQIKQKPLSDWADDFRDGVIGVASPTPEKARSCARLASVVSPPVAWRRTRKNAAPDRFSLLASLGGDYSADLFGKLAIAYYASVGVEAELSTLGPAAELAARIDAKNQRLASPIRIAAQRVDSPADALRLAAELRSDLAVAPLANGGGSALALRTRLIAADAVALVAEKNNPVRTLSRRDIKGLLSGAVTDWSMLQSALIGAPRLYLPPLRSAELAALTQYADVRRVQPASVRYIADPKQRLDAAMADPMGVAVVSRSALGGRVPLAIGSSRIGAKPTQDAIRQGAYPLILPVYLISGAAAAHPSASSFAGFLTGPEGQRAIYAAGLFPVAACDPSTCTLKLAGIEDARGAIEASAQIAPLTPASAENIQASAAGGPLAQISFPADDSVTNGETNERLAQAIYALAGAAGDRRLLVAARSVAGADQSVATLRAEAVALSLRCAGLSVARYGADARPNPGGEAGQLTIDILEDAGRP